MTEAEDLEAFIQEQKAKIAKERQIISKQEPVKERRKWERKPPTEILATRIQDNPPETPEETGLPFEGYGYEEHRKKLLQERKKEYNDLLINQPPGTKQPSDSPIYGALLVDTDDEKQKKLQEDRKKEYNELVQKIALQDTRRKPPPSPKHEGLPVGQYQNERKRLDEQRKKEYADFIKQHAGSKRKAPSPADQQGLQLGQYANHRAKLNEERHQEYNDFLKAQEGKSRPHLDSPKHEGFPVVNNQQQQTKFQEDRKIEYNKMLAEKAKVMNRNKENLPPESETPELGLISKLGEYEEKRKKLQEERRREYNELLAVKKEKIVPLWLQNDEPHNLENADRKLNGQQRRRKGNDDEQLGILNGLSDRSSAQEKKRRNQEEYKEYLNKQLKEQHAKSGKFKPYARHDAEFSDDDSPRGKSRRGDEDNYATLPGLRDHASAELRKMKERNREYNDYISAKKQAARGQSRYPESDEDDDRPVPRKGWATPTYEEILEKKRREERSYRRRNDPEYASGLRSSRSESNLHRPLPLDPFEDDERRFRNLDHEYETKKVHFRTDKQHVNPEVEFSEWPERMRHRADRAPSRYDNHSPDSRIHDKHFSENHKPQGYSQPTADHYGATLPIGSEHRASAEQRKKEAYRRELEQQMREFREKRTRERLDEVKPYAVSSRPDRQEYPERRDMPPQQPLASYRLNDLSPRTDSLDDPRKMHGMGILENGFQDLYKPSLPSQLSSTGAYRPQMDDPYMYYANRNPLDVAGMGLDPLIPLNRPLDRPPVGAQERPKVTFNDSIKPDSYRETAPARTPFPMDDDRSRSQKDAQRAYQEELKRQIEEQKLLKRRQKEETERYEKKLDEEVRKYDPFGRGGGGAPMRDPEGNVIADRRQLFQETTAEPHKAVQPPPETTYASSTVKVKTEQDGESFARGGHGIFGEPLSDAEKMKRNRYQEDLRKQIEDQKRLQELEKAKIKEEEKRLMQKIEEEQRKMQEELEAERRKEREKQEAAQRQQEELRRQQEEKKKEEERRRQEAEERRQAELRRQEEEHRKERQGSASANDRTASPPIPALRPKGEEPKRFTSANARTSSPPIPALRPKGEEPKQDQRRGVSPPVPAVRSKTEPPASPPVPAQRTLSRAQSRIASADVLNQLSRMRQQLQNERKRVESDLKQEQDEPEVYDPRLQTKAPSRSNIDVFEIARKKEAATVRRPPIDTNHKNLNDFKTLKNKEDSYKDLSHLEAEGLTDTRRGSTISAALLDSDSAFIDVPEDQLDSYGRNSRNNRNDSARNRRRMRSNTPKNSRADSVGSLTSLDPDIITRKNEDRLRKLKSLAGDDASLASADPDEVLDRFMAKQQHARPPSEQTLIDDSWIRPETKVT